MIQHNKDTSKQSISIQSATESMQTDSLQSFWAAVSMIVALVYKMRLGSFTYPNKHKLNVSECQLQLLSIRIKTGTQLRTLPDSFTQWLVFSILAPKESRSKAVLCTEDTFVCDKEHLHTTKMTPAASLTAGNDVENIRE